MKPKMIKIEDPDACCNCVHLRWGENEGWDKCGKHGQGIYWGEKERVKCGDHSRSRRSDPRCGGKS